VSINLLGQCGLGYDWDNSIQKTSCDYEHAALREIKLFGLIPSHLNISRFQIGPFGGMDYLRQYLRTVPRLLTPSFLSTEPADVLAIMLSSVPQI